MSGSTNVTIPGWKNAPKQATVFLHAEVSSAYLQRLSITDNNGFSVMMTGQGQNVIGSAVLPRAQNDVVYQVTIMYSSDNGKTWQPSQLKVNNNLMFGPNAVIAVESEDSNDKDFDDLVLYFRFLNPNNTNKGKK